MEIDDFGEAIRLGTAGNLLGSHQGDEVVEDGDAMGTTTDSSCPTLAIAINNSLFGVNSQLNVLGPGLGVLRETRLQPSDLEDPRQLPRLHKDYRGLL